MRMSSCQLRMRFSQDMEKFCEPLISLSNSLGMEQPRMISESCFQSVLKSYFEEFSEDDSKCIFHFFAELDPDNRDVIQMNFENLENWVCALSLCYQSVFILCNNRYIMWFCRSGSTCCGSASEKNSCRRQWNRCS